MISRDIIQRLLAIINETRSRVNTLESKENVLLTATQTLTNKTLTTPTIGNFTNAQHAHTDAASGGTIAHSSLTGLTTGDPHTQYALLAGRSGGQSLSGGTAANDDLTLQGTTNATRTTSYVIMQPNGGNVGIGTISPISTLQIYSASGGQTTAAITDAGSKAGLLTLTSVSGQAANEGGGILFGGYTSSNYFAAIKSLLQNGSNNTIGDLAFSTRNGLTDTALTERMRIRSDGNVGIGTTDPGANRLQVDGRFQVGDGTNKVWAFGGSSGGLTAGHIGTINNVPLAFFTNLSAPQVTILTNGNVGIGTTSPSTRLDIDNGALELAEMTAPGAGAANTVRIYAVDNGAGKTQLMAIFNTGAAQQLAIEP